MEDTAPSHHPRSEFLYPSGFLRVLLLQSECLCPNGFLRVILLRSGCLHPIELLRVLLLLPLSTHLFICEPRILAFGLGERLGNSRRVRLLSIVLPVLPHILAFGLGERLGNTRCVQLLSVVLPVLGLPFLPCGFVASIVPLVRAKVHTGR